MPIPADRRRTHYGPAWEKLSEFIRAQAGQRCQCRGECGDDHGGRCPACEGDAEPGPPDMFGHSPPMPAPVRLTVAHLNHVPGDDRPENLRVLCAACHLRYDRWHHARNRRQREIRERRAALEAAGQLRLW